MAWTELHGNLTAHPKLADLALILGIERWQAQGIVTCLWTHCLEYGHGGIIKDWRRFCASIGYSGDKEKLINALRESGWVEGDACHDWNDYAGRLEEIRRKDAERKRMSRGCPEDVHGNPRRPPNQPTNQPTDINQPTKPTNKKASLSLDVCLSLIPSDLALRKQAITEWLSHRFEIKKPPKSERSLMKMFDEMRKFGDRLQATVDHSIANGWQGLFEPKGGNNGNSKGGRTFASAGGVDKFANVKVSKIDVQ